MKPSHWTFEERASEAIVSWAESIAWYDGLEYLGHTMTKLDRGYRLVVRAQGQHNRKLVKIVYGASPAKCVALFNQSLRKRDIAEWKRDKFA